MYLIFQAQCLSVCVTKLQSRLHRCCAVCGYDIYCHMKCNRKLGVFIELELVRSAMHYVKTTNWKPTHTHTHASNYYNPIATWIVCIGLQSVSMVSVHFSESLTVIVHLIRVQRENRSEWWIKQQSCCDCIAYTIFFFIFIFQWLLLSLLLFKSFYRRH